MRRWRAPTNAGITCATWRAGGLGVHRWPQLVSIAVAEVVPIQSTPGRESESDIATAQCADPDLDRALRALSIDQRAVVVCRHLIGYSELETARALGIRPGTVKSRLNRALTGLRSSLAVTDEIGRRDGDERSRSTSPPPRGAGADPTVEELRSPHRESRERRDRRKRAAIGMFGVAAVGGLAVGAVGWADRMTQRCDPSTGCPELSKRRRIRRSRLIHFPQRSRRPRPRPPPPRSR